MRSVRVSPASHLKHLPVPVRLMVPGYSVTLYLEDVAGTLTVKVNRRIYPKFKAMIWDAKIGHDYILATVFKYPFLGKTIHIDQMWVIDPD